MSLFLSKYINNVDKKNRVSVPAIYRNLLSQEGGMILYPSIKNKCIEGCSMNRLQNIHKLIEGLEPYSDERDAFETIIMAESVAVSFDSEGRAIVPAALCEYAGVSSKACFVGKGRIFEIWEPGNFEEYLISAKKKAHENRLLLKNI